MPSIARGIFKIMRDWWRADRPRAAVADGRLLGLRPGDIIDVRSQLAEVRSRTVARLSQPPRVLYTCQAGPDDYVLSVSLRPSRCEVRWKGPASELEVFEDEIQVYSQKQTSDSMYAARGTVYI